MKVLLTGGAGYIGSHTAVSLTKAGHGVVILDNLSNSHPDVIRRIGQICNQDIPFIKADVRDTHLVADTIARNGCEAIIHLAGLKAVGDSVEHPIEYYSNNVHGVLSLLQAMARTGLKTLVFSSSATVYGEPQYLPIDELHPTSATISRGP